MKLFSAILVAVIGCAATREYSNSWAVEVVDGRERADLLAKKYDFDNEGQVCRMTIYYIYTWKHSQAVENFYRSEILRIYTTSNYLSIYIQ